MKAITLSVVAIAGIAAALLLFRKRDDRITFSDFAWTLRGKTAPFEFHVASRAGEKLTVLVVLEAHEIDPGRDGTRLHLVGLKRLEIELAPREERKITGALELLRFGNSSTIVSYTLGIKEPRRSPKPTAMSVTPPARPESRRP